MGAIQKTFVGATPCSGVKDISPSRDGIGKSLISNNSLIRDELNAVTLLHQSMKTQPLTIIGSLTLPRGCLDTGKVVAVTLDQQRCRLSNPSIATTLGSGGTVLGVLTAKPS